ncbi:MAG: hypothetical protein ABIJ45_01930 [Candidatus Zixiibacteriota bacterium]
MKNIILAAFWGILMSIFPASHSSAENRLILPDGIYYHRFTSITFGPEAVWINPAGLGFNKAMSVQMIGEIYESKLSKNWGFNVTGDGVGIAYRSLDEIRVNDTVSGKYTELTISGGKMLSNSIAGGMTFTYIKNAPDQYEKKNLWAIGLVAKPQSKFTYGLVFSNLGKAKFDGHKTDFEQFYSLTYEATPQIYLTTEMSLSGGQSLKEAVFNYGVDVHPMEGLYLYGNWKDGEGYEIGLRMNLLQYFIGGQSRHNKDNEHIGTSIYGGYVAEKQDSIIKEKKPPSSNY